MEVAELASRFGIQVKQLKRSKVEIQSDSLQEIATFAAVGACEAAGHPVVAEDAGFFVRALGGFPGPYSSYVYKTIGTDGILELLRNTEDRAAFFQAAVAYCRPRAHPLCFRGNVKGKVTRQAKGTQGFGFDPIFKPSKGDGRTFAQMNTAEKNRFSHRAKAFTGLFTWLRA